LNNKEILHTEQRHL